MFHDRAAKTIVQHMVFDRTHRFDATREKFERASVQWFDPSWIDECDGNSFLFKFARRFLGYFKHVAQSKNCYVASVLNDFGLANLEKFGFRFNFCARTGTARITDSDRAGVVVRHGPEHVDKFIFVLWLHVPPVRDVSQVPDVEQAVMRWAVVAA